MKPSFSSIVAGTMKHCPALTASLTALLVFSFLASAGGQELSSEQQAFLKEKKTIRFVSQTRYPPFEFVRETGERTGMCIELARWMATELGFNAAFEDMAFHDAQRAVLSGEADVLTSLFFSKKRNRAFDFTKVLFEVPASIFVSAQRFDIQAVEDLEGKRIAMQQGDYAKEFLESGGISFDVVYTKDFAGATNLVIAGKADALIGDEQIVLYHVFKEGLTDYVKKAGEPLYVGQDCMAVREGNQILVGILDKGIELARETGVIDKISDKWLGTRYSLTESVYFRYLPYIYAAAGLVVFLAFLAWVWNFRLRQLVSRRTEELRESEEKYRMVVENAAEGILLTQDMRPVFANTAFCKTLGYTEEELKEHPKLIEFAHPEDREMIAQNYLKRLNEESLPLVYTFRVVNRNGDVLWVDASGVRMMWKGRPAILNFFTDVSARMESEEQREKLQARLQHAQKMEAIGTLAGGVAHDFNNVLGGIKARTSLMMMDMSPNHAHHKRLKEIEEQIESAARLVRQLLGFAKGGKYQVRPTNLNDFIERTSGIFERTRKEICVHRDLEEGLWTVEVDRDQMEQTLLNIFVNAGDAMPKGGHLYLRSENVTVEEEARRPFEILPGRYVRLTISDTGTGMDPEVLERVFEPFFTTKAVGRGTGLGLASAYGIVKNHGGHLTVSSEKGRGATFSIYLPASNKKVRDEKKASRVPVKGHGRVMVVDDEDMIRDAEKEVLKALGYDVVVAADGKEAVDIYSKEWRRIDAVILDVIMPGMSGGETYDRLKEINPDVRAILLSGYSLEGDAAGIMKKGCNDFIQKPFSIEELSHKLKNLLEGGQREDRVTS